MLVRRGLLSPRRTSNAPPSSCIREKKRLGAGPPGAGPARQGRPRGRDRPPRPRGPDAGLRLDRRDLRVRGGAGGVGQHGRDHAQALHGRADPGGGPRGQRPRRVRYALGDIDRVLGAVRAIRCCASRSVTLTPTDGFVLSRVDGTLARARDHPADPAAAGGDAEEPVRPALHGRRRVDRRERRKREPPAPAPAARRARPAPPAPAAAASAHAAGRLRRRHPRPAAPPAPPRPRRPPARRTARRSRGRAPPGDRRGVRGPEATRTHYEVLRPRAQRHRRRR